MWCVAYSPNGTQIASGCNDNSVLVSDAKNGFDLIRLLGHTDSVSTVLHDNLAGIDENVINLLV